MKLSNNESGYILTTNSYEGPTHWDNDGALLAWQQAILLVNEFWVSIKHCPDLTCCEVVIGEYRFKVCVGMPENIFAYMDYVEPKEEPAPPGEMQYINRRDFMPDGTRGDMALWPTFCPITSPGWVQIGCRPIQAGYHSEGDTLLVYSGSTPRPEKEMNRVLFAGDMAGGPLGIWVHVSKLHYNSNMHNVHAINFTKGDHLSEAEVAAYHALALGYEEQIMSQFK